MRHLGKLLILLILALAIGAASFSIWYLRGLSLRSMEFYGLQAGQLILQAPVVEAMRLEPADATAEPATSETLTVDARTYAVIQRRDISRAKGLINVRRGLMNDASYHWEEAPSRGPLRWEYALRFRDGDRQATLLFSLDQGLVMPFDNRRRPISFRPVKAGLEAFFAEQFGAG